jgi:hypothetical protein
MAGAERLNASRGRRLLVLLALVLLAHAVALDWITHQIQQRSSILRQMPAPILTRLLQPEAPVAPTPAPAIAPNAPARAAVTSIARKPVAPRPKRAASAAAPPAAPAMPAEEPGVPAVAAAQPAEAPAAEPASAVPEPTASTPSATDTVAIAPQPPASSAQAAVPGRDSEGWPIDTRLNYRLGGLFRHGELHGSARVQWQREDQRYQTRVDIDITLLVSLAMTSQGEVTPLGLKPEAFEELRRGGPRTARFGEDSVVLSDGRRVPRPPGVQDTASQFVELSHRFSSGRDPLEVGRSVSMWMARPGGVDLWTYDVVGLDRLRTPDFGSVEAFHLIPRPISQPRGNITAEIWFAPSLQYLPVRIKVNMGEDTYVDLMVEKIEQR